MVGRLVQEQHVGPGEQKFREREAHQPAAGELTRIPREVILAKAEPAKDRARLGLDGVAAQALEARLQASVLGEEGVVLIGLHDRHLVLDHAQAVLQCGHVFGRGEGLVKDGAPGHLDGFLLQIANDGVLGEADGALVAGIATGDDLEQGGLAGTVRADQRDTVAYADTQRRALEEDAFAEGLGEVVY